MQLNEFGFSCRTMTILVFNNFFLSNYLYLIPMPIAFIRRVSIHTDADTLLINQHFAIFIHIYI